VIERDKKAQNLSDMWQGNNLTFEGLKQVLQGLGVKTEDRGKLSVEEVNKDWSKLANFMAKHQG